LGSLSVARDSLILVRDTRICNRINAINRQGR
jgi:hypothetical protein